MKKTLLGLILFSICPFINSQQPPETDLQFIEVTGSAEMTIIPDEIVMFIGIQEYLIDEFSGNQKTTKNYITKVPIWVIENNLFTALNKIGVTKDEIKTEDITNYGRDWGKQFQFAEQVTFSLKSVEQVNGLFQTIDTKGIEFIRIKELKNKNITEYNKQVKREALEAAEMKAKFLVESMCKQLGDVISIIELEPENTYYSYAINHFSNEILKETDSENNNMKGIKLRYEVKVRFRITN
jgi:uncharacterized protein